MTSSICSSVKSYFTILRWPGIHRLGVTQHGGDEQRPAALVDLGELGGVVGAFAKQGVAAHAVVLLPDFLAANDRFGQVVGIGLGRYALERVNREPNEHRAKKQRTRQEERARGRLRQHGHLLLRRPMSPGDGRDATRPLRNCKLDRCMIASGAKFATSSGTFGLEQVPALLSEGSEHRSETPES